MPKALVIGGGAAGLTAARALQATGWTVLVVDK
ncbi:MAG: FAD-dependent oxidoreductase, partial [Planctomycetia bacterium]